MGMRIRTNVSALIAQRNLQNNSQRAEGGIYCLPRV